MKSRNGFVSNSSSSSFVIAYKKDKDEQEIPETPKSKLMKELAGWSDLTADEILKSEDYSYSSDEIKAKVTELKDKGYGFAEVTVGYGGETNDDCLRDSDGVIMLSDGSY